MIKRLWETLENQSILLVAERRIGKTTIIRKMAVESPNNTVVIVRDVGGISNAIEFVERVTQDVEKYLNRSKKTARRFKAALESLSGTEFKMLGIKIPDIAASHWKTLLEKVIADLAEENSQQAILIWDEMPWMLQKIKKTAGETEAMNVLDILRGLRQTYTNLRMVYTGSIGLHHVITAFREEGYANSPLNDMRTVDVPPLDNSNAKELAKKLIQGEELESDRLDDTASKIAELVDAVPYYIHHNSRRYG
jgi:AAA+ ATPase superfamily predicted ATPase